MQIPIANLTIYGDSELIVKQLQREYTVSYTESILSKKRVKSLPQIDKKLLIQFEKAKILHVHRVIIAPADALTGLAASLLSQREKFTYNGSRKEVVNSFARDANES